MKDYRHRGAWTHDLVWTSRPFA